MDGHYRQMRQLSEQEMLYNEQVIQKTKDNGCASSSSVQVRLCSASRRCCTASKKTVLITC
jgi:hypothetical protein